MEWDKIEALQEEKIKLAERMERIVARARERARNEWTRVGGIDVDELAIEVGKGWELGMGSGEIVLPPSGLGSGSDVRQKSTSFPAHKSRLLHIHILDTLSCAHTNIP